MMTLDVREPGCLQRALQLLNRHGVEPEIDGGVLRFKPPRGKRRGERFLKELYYAFKPSCMICGGGETTYLVRCGCGKIGAFCSQCLKGGRFYDCRHGE